jgi:hypothetical protein
MLLNEYPTAIAQVERELLNLEKQSLAAQESLNAHSAAAEREVVFDESLKNDAQRKARRADLLACNADYQQILAAHQKQCDCREQLQIDLSLFRNEFSVLKLELRRAIVFQEHQLLEAA